MLRPNPLQSPSEFFYSLITISCNSCRPRPSERLAKVATKGLEGLRRHASSRAAFGGDVFHPSALKVVDLARLVRSPEDILRKGATDFVIDLKRGRERFSRDFWSSEK